VVGLIIALVPGRTTSVSRMIPPDDSKFGRRATYSYSLPGSRSVAAETDLVSVATQEMLSEFVPYPGTFSLHRYNYICPRPFLGYRELCTEPVT
jgi:hypothetical protein